MPLNDRNIPEPGSRKSAAKVAVAWGGDGYGPDLGFGIGTGRWYLNLATLTGLVSFTLGLGAFSAGLTPHTPANPFDPLVETVMPQAPIAPEPEIVVAAEAEAPSPEPAVDPLVRRRFKIGKGDTLMDLVMDAGAGSRESFMAVTALGKIYNPKRLMLGQEVVVAFRPSDGGKLLLESVLLQADIDHSVSATVGDDGEFEAMEARVTLASHPVLVTGAIDDSLFLSARRQRIPVSVIIDFIRIFSFDVDFQREIRAGDRFEVYFERFQNETGDIAKNGEVLFASLTLRGKPLSLYRFTPSDDGRTDYFNSDGVAARKALMRTPVDGARLTSRYGVRKHPVLGYSLMHRGIDFGARRGTPIMAAGDGVVQRSSRNGSYGKYIRIRHNSQYSTAYGHLNAYGRGIKSGAKVQQGQIIGYVGSTGRTTGPHLHYEVLANGRQINPLTLKLPTGRKLDGTELAAFLSTLADLESGMEAAASDGLFASTGCDPAAEPGKTC